MKSVKNVSGEFYQNMGSLERLLITIISAYISFVLLYYIHLKPILESIIPLKIPFKGLSIFGGFFIVFWVALTYRVCGKGYGIAVSLLAVSFCLFVSPWFGIVKPYWFGIFGFISFLVLGILTEKVNGGVGLAVCTLINWVSFSYYVIYINPINIAVMSIISFISGISGDFAARKIVEFLLSGFKFS